MDFEIRPHTILLTRAGSRAYGMHNAESDLDLKGVAIAPKRYYTGCMFNFEQAQGAEHMLTFADLIPPDEMKNGVEGTIYEIKKFMKLWITCNPSMLDILYVRDNDVLLSTKVGELLREHRDDGLSIKIYWSYSRYAMAQLRKINSHRDWMLKPLEAIPTRTYFKLPEIYEKNKFDAALDAIRKKLDSWELNLTDVDDLRRAEIMAQLEDTLVDYELTSDKRWVCAARAVGFSDDMMEILEREKKYRSALKEWKSFTEWKKKRNPERAALEMKYGYDCKFAVHLCRLMRQCREIMETGKVRVWRGDIDADELIAIRNGSWTYEQVLDFATKEDKALSELKNSGKHVLRTVPDVKAIDNLCQKIFETVLCQ